MTEMNPDEIILKVKLLREKLGVGMFDAKKALIRAQGDMEIAEWYLWNKGLAIVCYQSVEEQVDEMVRERDKRQSE